VEVLDKIVYRFFGFLDDAISFVETGELNGVGIQELIY
jgi:hypothetical protein